MSCTARYLKAMNCLPKSRDIVLYVKSTMDITQNDPMDITQNDPMDITQNDPMHIALDSEIIDEHRSTRKENETIDTERVRPDIGNLRKILGASWLGRKSLSVVKYQVIAVYDSDGYLVEKLQGVKAPKKIVNNLHGKFILMVKSDIKLIGAETTELIKPSHLEERIEKDKRAVSTMKDQIDRESTDAEYLKVVKRLARERAAKEEEEQEAALAGFVRGLLGNVKMAGAIKFIGQGTGYFGGDSDEDLEALLEKIKRTGTINYDEAQALRKWKKRGARGMIEDESGEYVRRRTGDHEGRGYSEREEFAKGAGQ